MSSHEAFLADIIENPDDDAPRLIYADWLEDNDDPERAEFIRLQCRAVTLPAGPRRAALETRIAELLEDHKEEWTRDIVAIPGVGVDGFERGLPAYCSADFLEMGRSIRKRLQAALALAPWRNLSLHSANPHQLERALNSDGLEHLRRLVLSNLPIGPRCAHLLAGCDRLRRLVELDISDQFVGDEALAALTAAPQFATLENLNLAGNGLTPGGVAVLANSPYLRLKVLWIDRNAIGPRGAELIAASPSFAGLGEVHFSDCGLGAEGAGHLADSPHLAGLRILDVYNNQLGDDGAQALAGTRHLTGVEELPLQFNGIGPRGTAALARGRLFESVRELLLLGNAIGPDGAAALADSRRLKRLEELIAGDCQIGAEGARRLGASERLGKVRLLSLHDNAIGDAGVRGLLAGPLLGRLEHLWLSGNGLTDESARAIAACPGLAKLKELDLDDNQIGTEGAVALAESPHLEAITHLILRTNPIGRPGKQALRERFGERVMLS